MNKKIFLTGGTGFVGRFLGTRLLEEGDEVIFLARGNSQLSVEDRINKALKFVIPDCRVNKDRYRVLQGEISSEKCGLLDTDISVLLKSDIEEVWHSAASLSFSFDKAGETYKTNVIGTRNLLKLMEDMRPKEFHYICTAYVCGSYRGFVSEDVLDYGQTFHNPYEETKFLAERMVRIWAENNPQTKVFIYRPSIIVGDSITGKCSSFTGYYRYIRAFHVGRKMLFRNDANGIHADVITLPIHVPGVPDSPLNIVTIDYVINQMIKLRNAGIGGVYHITSQNPATFPYWVNEGLKALGIQGVQIGGNGVEAGDKSQAMQTLENQISANIKDYLPYISGHPEFSQENVKNALGKEYQEHCPVTPELVKRLLDYAANCNFKDVEQ